MGSFGPLQLFLPLLLFYILVGTHKISMAESSVRRSFNINDQRVSPPHAIYHSAVHPPNTLGESRVRPRQTNIPSLHKRRVPIRPSESKAFGAAPTKTNTIRVFRFQYVFTDQGFDALLTAMLNTNLQVIAALLTGIDVDQHALAFRVGAFTLDLYAVGEALTRDMVLAVLNRLVQLLRIRTGMGLAEGVVVVGAGVRVLFAAGVQLQGFDDIRDLVQILTELIG